MLEGHDVFAVVNYHEKRANGRGIPVSSGYQPKFFFDGVSWVVEHVYALEGDVYPGDRVEVYFRFFDDSVPLEKIYRGMSFDLVVGETAVGEGTVLAVGGSEG